MCITVVIQDVHIHSDNTQIITRELMCVSVLGESRCTRKVQGLSCNKYFYGVWTPKVTFLSVNESSGFYNPKKKSF